MPRALVRLHLLVRLDRVAVVDQLPREQRPLEVPDPPDAGLELGWCQLLLVGAMAWAAYSLMVWIPNWPINPQLAPSHFFTMLAY